MVTKRKISSAGLLNGAFGENQIETTGKDYYIKSYYRMCSKFSISYIDNVTLWYIHFI